MFWRNEWARIECNKSNLQIERQLNQSQPINLFISFFSFALFSFNLPSIKLWFEWRKINERREEREKRRLIGFISLVSFICALSFNLLILAAFINQAGKELKLIPKFQRAVTLSHQFINQISNLQPEIWKKPAAAKLKLGIASISLQGKRKEWNGAAGMEKIKIN